MNITRKKAFFGVVVTGVFCFIFWNWVVMVFDNIDTQKGYNEFIARPAEIQSSELGTATAIHEDLGLTSGLVRVIAKTERGTDVSGVCAKTAAPKIGEAVRCYRYTHSTSVDCMMSLDWTTIIVRIGE